MFEIKEIRTMTKEIAATRIATAKVCLSLISRIAGRGASSDDPEAIGYALEELSQVLVERSETEMRLFEPVPADNIRDLDLLLDELGFVDSFSSSVEANGQ
jgi:hypothetical protein